MKLQAILQEKVEGLAGASPEHHQQCRNADRIYVLVAGEIAEHEKYEDLIWKGGAKTLSQSFKPNSCMMSRIFVFRSGRSRSTTSHTRTRLTPR